MADFGYGSGAFAPHAAPSSLLRSRGLNPLTFMGGLLMTGLAHVALPVAIHAVLPILQEIGLFGEGRQPAIEERTIVAAHFVQLGKPPDPRKLPDRVVPRQTTAPDTKTVVSKNMNPEKPKRPKEKLPKESVEDLLTRLGDRAKAFQEIAEEREREGDPEGIAEGTAKKAKAGNLYAGKIYAFFKKGWTVPETMSAEERKSLVAGVMVSIAENGKLDSFKIKRPSGNPLFDQSVLDRLQALRKADAKLPEPPPEVAQDYLGQTIRLNFKGKDAM